VNVSHWYAVKALAGGAQERGDNNKKTEAPQPSQADAVLKSTEMRKPWCMNL
jgi:hypothetical protein